MINNRLRKIRDINDLKQKDIAKILSVNKSCISSWETAKDIIPLRRLVEYANYFDTSLDYLFGLTQDIKCNYKKLNIDVPLLARNLRILRKENNMTQTEVGEKLNISQAAYSHYERGKYLITTNFLYSLTKIYEPFSIDLLFGRKK